MKVPGPFSAALSCISCLRLQIPLEVAMQFVEEEMDSEREDKTIYKVVVNHEEQYSIWPAHRDNALGWKDAGKSGTKEECLAYIKEVWTDMRPLSLRKKMQEQGLG
jgi:MbtH protein